MPQSSVATIRPVTSMLHVAARRQASMNAALRSDTLIGQILALDVERRDRLQEAIVDRLQRSGHKALGQVSVEVTAEVVVLRGTLTSFYLKQLAQEHVRGVTAHYDIDNRIAVLTQR